MWGSCETHIASRDVKNILSSPIAYREDAQILVGALNDIGQPIHVLFPLYLHRTTKWPSRDSQQANTDIRHARPDKWRVYFILWHPYFCRIAHLGCVKEVSQTRGFRCQSLRLFREKHTNASNQELIQCTIRVNQCLNINAARMSAPFSRTHHKVTPRSHCNCKVPAARDRPPLSSPPSPPPPAARVRAARSRPCPARA